jgi:hypothetical protein
MSKSEKKQAASITWFEIPADDVERAKKFYGDLFGWKIERFPGPQEYWHIDTGGGDDTPDGALKKRKQPQEPVVNYVSVIQSPSSPKRSRNLVVKSAWGKRPCRRWATSPCARIPRGTRLEFGRLTRTRNNLS